MKNTSLVSLGGILTCLSIFIMFLSSLFPFLEMAMPAFAGIVLLVLVIEDNFKWAILVYVAVSILSIILISNKQAMVMYIFFFGYYIILKVFLDRKYKRTVRIIIKLIVFNVAMAIATAIITYVFHVPFEEFDKYGKYGVVYLFLMANVFLIVYDYAISSIMNLYNRKYRKRFRKIFK